MPLFEVTEVVRYRIHAEDWEEAIEVLTQADDPDQYFYCVDGRTSVEVGGAD